MSILGAMFTAVSGVNAQSRSLGHISDNIANSQTTGYKKVETRFETLITVSNQNLHSPGGVIASPYYANAVQGNITQTQNNTNLAITGSGFFVVSRATNQSATQTTFEALRYYTRAGDFQVNRDGYLVNNGGYYLNGWNVDPETGVVNTSVVAPIQISQVIDQPTPTSEIEFVGNLPANSPVNPSTPLSPTSVQVFDALGNPHNVSLVWTKRADNLWMLDIQANDSTLDPVAGTISGVNDQTATTTTLQPNVAPVAQVDTVTLPAAGMAPGRTITMTIGSNTVSVTAPSTGYTATQAASALVAAINGNAGMSAVVTGTNVVGNTFQIVADVAGTPFTTNIGGNGSGQLEGVQVVALPTVADTASITINGTTVTVTGPLASATAVRDALVTAINANGTLAPLVTAVADPDSADQLLIQSDAALGTFTISFGGTSAPTSASSDAPTNPATTTANVAPVAQTDTLTLGGTVGPGEIGDTYTLTIGTQSISYVADGTELSLSDLANRFAAQINANPGLGITAAAAGGIISLTATNAGVPFTSAATATNGTVPGFIDVQFGQTPATAGTIVGLSNQFNPSGNASVPVLQTGGQDAIISFQVDYGLGLQTIELNLGQFQTTAGLTQFAGSDIDVSRLIQDGVPQGLLSDVRIRDNGDVELQYDNGRSRIYFRVPIAQFNDPSALQREVAQGFTETFDSGAVRIGNAGDNGAGTMRGSALEGSNVDIAEEFSKMIVTQRAFSANTRVITTADEMLADIINIKR
ncbi:flagellar hook-basal body complex protein [Dongia deserti]|uniref:flagellar hook-basal body complex protein n=1 Tax=Dongia deserti TaxID=2268030 RepID=UPI000E656943|nr:flagellar hook-basal body complex protein [Dongia deserti]